jgi:hypothetical protein
MTTFSDNQLIAQLKARAEYAREKFNTRDLNSIQICNTEEDRQFVIYGISNQGGGSGDDVYVSYIKADGTLDKETRIPQDNSPYFGCFGPLVLTTKQVLYMDCGGGDGGYGAASIYKLNLNDSTSVQVIKCTSTITEDGQSNLECSDMQ